MSDHCCFARAQVLTSFTVTETDGGAESYHLKESGGSDTVAR